MKEQHVTINELISKTIDELRRVGYCEMTIYGNYYRCFKKVARYYDAIGESFYSLEKTGEMLKLQEDRLNRGEITDAYYRKIKLAVSRLNEYFISGTTHLPSKAIDEYIISLEFENLVDRFLDSKEYSSKARHDARWVTRKYGHYLGQNGHNTLEDVSVEEVREYILKTATELRASSLHNILLYLKHFHIFLKENGIPAPECIDLFSYTVYRDMPVQGCITDEEFQRIYDVIDTETVMGKRDLAIIELASTTGLRAVDIIKLTLDDIDWDKAEIHTTQSKTGQSITLPLIDEAANALADYIKNGRLDSQSNLIFLRTQPPCYPISDSSSIGFMFRSYEKKAGIVR